MNSKVVYATLLFIGYKKKKKIIYIYIYIYSHVVVCEEKKRVGKKRIILFIILLGSLYYFIGLYVKIKTEI